MDHLMLCCFVCLLMYLQIILMYLQQLCILPRKRYFGKTSELQWIKWFGEIWHKHCLI